MIKLIGIFYTKKAASAYYGEPNIPNRYNTSVTIFIETWTHHPWISEGTVHVHVGYYTTTFDKCKEMIYVEN